MRHPLPYRSVGQRIGLRPATLGWGEFANQGEVRGHVGPQLFARDCAFGELFDVGAMMQRQRRLATYPIRDR